MNENARQVLIRANQLSRVYADGDVQALRGVSLSVFEGESVAITGPSGCGKSTLLQILGYLDQPTEGTVEFEGKALKEIDPDVYRALKIGFVFQSFYLLPTLNALENVQIPMFESATPVRDRRSRAEALLQEVGMAHRAAKLPNTLSVGERQRVAIARALANDPKALLADEPTGNLDSQSQGEVLHLLDRLRCDRDLTLLIVTHSNEVANAADRVIKMRDGLILEAKTSGNFS